MAKRFTDSEKWNDPWFMEISPDMKLVWGYLTDNCNHAGIWKINNKLAGFQLGFPLDADSIPEKFKGRIFRLGDYFFIPKFLTFQYGPKLGRGKAVFSALELIECHGFTKIAVQVLGNPFIRVMEGLGKGSLGNKAKAKAKATAIEDHEQIKRSPPLPPSPSENTPPKPLTDIQKVITVYKIACGFDKDDKKWDENFFPKFTRAAKELIGFMGNWKDAADCVQDTVEKIRAWNPEATITIQTIFSNHAAEWKKNKQEMGGRNHGVLPMQEMGGRNHGVLPMPNYGGLSIKLRTVDEIAGEGAEPRKVPVVK
jgi:hypothetical protein